MDIIPANGGKGLGVKKVLDYVPFTKEEAIAFGDSINDIEMLQASGLSYAVSNSRPEVQAAAKNTCPPYWENGVLQVLKTFL